MQLAADEYILFCHFLKFLEASWILTFRIKMDKIQKYFGYILNRPTTLDVYYQYVDQT